MPPISRVGRNQATGYTEQPAGEGSREQSGSGKQLEMGAKGPSVRDLQSLLKSSGIDTQVDGIFGPKTAESVRTFQRRHNLPETGVVDASTSAKLVSRPFEFTDGMDEPARQRNQGTRSAEQPAGEVPQDRVKSDGAQLEVGAKGQTVRDLQSMLQRAGFDTKVDGIFGPKTAESVKAFQRRHDLPETGVVDASTFAKLAGKPLEFKDGMDEPVGRRQGPATAEPTKPQTGPPASGVATQNQLPFTPNAAAIAKARQTVPGQRVEQRTGQFAPMYRKVEKLTGVPAEMVAAIHANESGQSMLGKEPESGFGLDPRFVTTSMGNRMLAKHGLGPWQRGTNTATSQLQSGVVAAEVLKKQASSAGIDVGPQMSSPEMAGAIAAYASGAGAGKKALETGRCWLFDPQDNQPHPRHPGGSSIGKSGQVVRVRPGVKEGLLRWDVLLPMIQEKLKASS
ncbi:MAG: peptidoglycan-binding protein [Deltaproteobacteria bacterium]|nr:peptidoglycan-binding protein [Deltaproteobacteria bacterium]